MRFDAMDLKLYDTLTREKRVFKPLDPANVRMYVCGPTVYDFAHIGNARPVIVFDVLFRLLRHIYGEKHVTYVRNITDVDDKINARAAEEYPDLPLNDAIRQVTEKTDRQFHDDVAALGCLPPTIEPRATEHIAEMRALIDRLVASGNAYVAEDNVLFSVPSMADYGKLSKRPLDEMIAGTRVEVAPYKRDAMDFVLWKPSKPGEPAWPSPAGITTPGRPGWHIECSAMADKWLWTEALSKLSESGRAHPHQFDIHGGGIDLLFPHHEDEIAQSRCAFHTPALANYWLHNGFLQVEGEKMSKSLGNFVTIRELLDTDRFGGRRWSGDTLRLAMLRTHYRQPIDWIVSALEESERVLADWHETLRRVNYKPIGPPDEFLEALLDDLSTSKAITLLHRYSAHANGAWSGFGTPAQPPDDLGEPAASKLFAAGQLLGLFSDNYVSSRKKMKQFDSATTKWVELLVRERDLARSKKDFRESDRIRDELAKMGVVLKDSKDGTTWEIAR
jgi:cysteinyl-tRNA synthetase